MTVRDSRTAVYPIIQRCLCLVDGLLVAREGQARRTQASRVAPVFIDRMVDRHTRHSPGHLTPELPSTTAASAVSMRKVSVS